MKRTIVGVATLAAAALVLAGCSSGDSSSSSSSDAGGDASSDSESSDSGSSEPVTLSLAGWSLSTTPEFQLLVDGFQDANPNVTIELREYDAANYDTQLTADLAAGSAPDMYPIKTVTTFPTYQEGGQLVDVSDVAGELADGISGLDSYTTEDGGVYAIPYRQDSWYLYYNKDLFDAAGVAYPDGSWTWEDYQSAADALNAGLSGAGSDAKAAYLHGWQSLVQSFANAQAATPEQYLAGEWDYMTSYYEQAIAMQDAGNQEDYGSVTTNSLTYQGQFGTQKAAMMLMGSWYVATLVTQVGTGDAETFNWGFAPVPQVDSSTVDLPVTQGNPTAIGISPAIDDAKLDAAKAFLAYIGSEDAAVDLAGIGIAPAFASDAVTDSMFSLEGVPTDDLSKFAFSTHETYIEAALGPNTPALQNILKDAHSAIMSESVTPADGIAQAIARAQSEVLG